MDHQCGACGEAGCSGLCRANWCGPVWASVGGAEHPAARFTADWREELDAAQHGAFDQGWDMGAAEVDRLRRVLGDCWVVLKGADMLTHDELCDELEVVLGGLPAAHERRAANQRDRLAHALRQIAAGMLDPVLIARAALAEVER